MAGGGTVEDEQRLSLPEDLLLIAVDPYTGMLRMPTRLPHGVAGAVLAKLLAEGRVWPLRGGRVYARDSTPTGDDLLDTLVAELAAQRGTDGRPRGRDTRRWLREIGLRVTRPYMNRLIARDVLGMVALPARPGAFHDVRFPLLAPDAAGIAFGQVDQAVRSPLPPEPRALLLAALAAAVRLETCFYPYRGDAALRRRMGQLVHVFPVTQTVHDLVLMDEAMEMRQRGYW